MMNVMGTFMDTCMPGPSYGNKNIVQLRDMDGEKRMIESMLIAIDPLSAQAFVSAGTPLVGGGLVGFCLGWAIKKVMKLAFLAIGLVALLLGYLEMQKWISVNWITVENQTSTMMTSVAHKAYVVTQHMSHVIPIGLGAVGFLPGLAIGMAKG